MSTAPRPVGPLPELEAMRRFWARCKARPGGRLVARNTVAGEKGIIVSAASKIAAGLLWKGAA